MQKTLCYRIFIVLHMAIEDNIKGVIPLFFPYIVFIFTIIYISDKRLYFNNKVIIFFLLIPTLFLHYKELPYSVHALVGVIIYWIATRLDSIKRDDFIQNIDDSDYYSSAALRYTRRYRIDIYYCPRRAEYVTYEEYTSVYLNDWHFVHEEAFRTLFSESEELTHFLKNVVRSENYFVNDRDYFYYFIQDYNEPHHYESEKLQEIQQLMFRISSGCMVIICTSPLSLISIKY